jgi:hypothetical protein
MSIGKSNPRRKKYLIFISPVNESFACWQSFQLDFGAGARIGPAPNHSSGWFTATADLNRWAFSKPI